MDVEKIKIEQNREARSQKTEMWKEMMRGYRGWRIGTRVME